MEVKLLEKLDSLTQRIEAIDDKMEKQGGRLDQAVIKVDPVLEAVGKIQQEQVQAARLQKNSANPNQESVLLENVQKPLKKLSYKSATAKGDSSSSGGDSLAIKPERAELWKAKQPRDYRRANGLCFKCGDKYSPDHQCAVIGQIKAMEITEVVSDDLLNAVVAEEDSDHEDNCHISLNALSGATHYNAIRLRALVQNKILLMLVDSGSFHSFIDFNFVKILGLQLQLIVCV